MFQRPAPNVCSIHFQYAPMHGFRSLNNKIYIITQYYNYFSTSSPNYFPVPQTISRRQPTRRQPKSRIREPSFFLFQSEYIQIIIFFNYFFKFKFNYFSLINFLIIVHTLLIIFQTLVLYGPNAGTVWSKRWYCIHLLQEQRIETIEAFALLQNPKQRSKVKLIIFLTKVL